MHRAQLHLFTLPYTPQLIYQIHHSPLSLCLYVARKILVWGEVEIASAGASLVLRISLSALTERGSMEHAKGFGRLSR